MKNKIELGDTVKCIHTGFKGVAVARTEFINGCIQYSVAPKVKNDNKIEDEIGMDENSLEVVEPRKKETEKETEEEITGGPNSAAPSMRGH